MRWMQRSAALLAAGAMLLSSTAALAAPEPVEDMREERVEETAEQTVQPPAPVVEPVTEPAEEPEPAPEPSAEPEPGAEPEPLAEPAVPEPAQVRVAAVPVVRFLLCLPSGVNTAILTDSAGTQWQLPAEADQTRVAAVPPGEYALECGSHTAELTVAASGEVTVRSGGAAWDGEQLTVGSYGTLELCCTVQPEEQRLLQIEAGGEVHTRAAGYDPQLDAGQGCVVTHILTLPAGAVTVTVDGVAIGVELEPGETLRWYL